MAGISLKQNFVNGAVDSPLRLSDAWAFAYLSAAGRRETITAWMAVILSPHDPLSRIVYRDRALLTGQNEKIGRSFCRAFSPCYGGLSDEVAAFQL